MKIGIFTETYEPTINGVVVSVNTFKKELERLGHEYFIFCPFNNHAKNDPDNVFRFPAIHFHRDPIYPLAIPMPFSWVKQQLPLDIIRELDIIHIQHFALMGQYGLKFAEIFKIPSLYTYHTMAELYTVNAPLLAPVVEPPIRALTRHTARHARHVITPTPSVKSYLRSIGVEKPISVVPTGIDISEYRRVPSTVLRNTYRIPHDHKLLVFVGRLAAEKNVPFLLEAFKQVLRFEPKSHLVLVGGGPDKEVFEAWVIKNKLKKHVTFTGFIGHDEVKQHFGVADLFVFPSITDTQGIVVLEAMAAGAVPIAIDRLGPHDLIESGKSGMLVDLNIDAFSGTIIDLLRNDRRRLAMVKEAMRHVKQYDHKETAKQMEAVYLKLQH